MQTQKKSVNPIIPVPFFTNSFKTMASNSMALPSDVMFEILTSSYLDDLASWRQVSREFHEMSKEKTFKSQHILKTKTTIGYLIERCNRSTDYSFISEYPIKCPIESISLMKKGHIIIEAVSQCRGLICCLDTELDKEQYYVCKPATCQYKAIPNPNLSYRTVATAMVASSTGPADFKIIRFSLPLYNDRNIFCEIFDSRRWTWHRSKDIEKDIYFPGQGLGRRSSAVFAFGSVHWLIKDFVERKIYIFAFDVEKETWETIDVETSDLDLDFEIKCRSKLIARDGKLRFVIMENSEEASIWTMERYSAKAWSRKEVEQLKDPKNLKEEWLEFFMEFFHSNEFPSHNCFFTDAWEKIWKKKLNKIGYKEFYMGEAFKIESDFAHCKCLT
ncbi:hypothetical protein LUZ60_002387 [Juncus effusus]|nr:hypothetical protein LUZ60_002387 [Juncus effusus]